MSGRATQWCNNRADGHREIWIRKPLAKCGATQVMRPSTDLPEVFLCRDVVDFRKGINGLSVLVEDALGLDLFSEQLFVFCSCSEKQKFKWPRKVGTEIITLTGQQFNWLLGGYDVLKKYRMRP